MSEKKLNNFSKVEKKRKVLSLIGNIFIILSLFGLYFTFGQILINEGEYQIKKTMNIKNYIKETPDAEQNAGTKFLKRELTPPNLDFSIVIPKIGAAAPVISDVDPFNEREFLKALRYGVAQAKKTSYPGGLGNVYIFAHSTDAFYNVGRYNAVFYLIGKLSSGDEIYIYYKGNKYTYVVFNKMVVNPENIEYLGTIKPGFSTLTLQTCYPPGTTLRRLIVLAQLADGDVSQ